MPEYPSLNMSREDAAATPSPARAQGAADNLTVDFTDFNLEIRFKDKKGPISRTILNNLSGSFEVGKMTAIIGPSGCGKSTLLNFLSGRSSKESIPNSTFSGTVSLNNATIDPVNYKQRFAYVMAEDAIYPTTTPREAFSFVCKLRLPSLTEEERTQRAEKMLEVLGLTGCADTYIGNALLKGISSGEKKRTAVGIELLPDPEVCFLDEPTTGLDSFRALELIRVSRKIADSGKTVIAVIHQPSSEIFDLFDDVIFMSKGYIVYNGPVKDVVPYFADRGFQCPSDYNPADYVMYILQTIDMDQLRSLDEAWRVRSNKIREKILTARKEFASSHEPLVLEPIKQAPLSAQMKGLFSRELLRTVRDPSALVIRFGITIFLGVVVGCIFYQVGTTTTSDGSISSSHRGGITNACIFAMFGSGQSMLINLPYDRPVIIREYANGLYNLTACVLARVLVEIPINFATNLVLAFLVYFLEGFVGNFMLFVLALFLLGCATMGTALLFGSAFKVVEKSVELSFVIFIPQILFSGFFISIDQIPALFQWAQWLCSIKYAINIAYIAELTDLKGYQQVFDSSDVNQTLLWLYIFILVCIMIATVALSIILLHRRSKSVY